MLGHCSPWQGDGWDLAGLAQSPCSSGGPLHSAPLEKGQGAQGPPSPGVFSGEPASVRPLERKAAPGHAYATPGWTMGKQEMLLGGGCFLDCSLSLGGGGTLPEVFVWDPGGPILEAVTGIFALRGREAGEPHPRAAALRPEGCRTLRQPIPSAETSSGLGMLGAGVQPLRQL